MFVRSSLLFLGDSFRSALMALLALVSVSVSVANSLTAALICRNHEDRS